MRCLDYVRLNTQYDLNGLWIDISRHKPISVGFYYIFRGIWKKRIGIKNRNFALNSPQYLQFTLLIHNTPYLLHNHLTNSIIHYLIHFGSGPVPMVPTHLYFPQNIEFYVERAFQYLPHQTVSSFF